jgi:hypothetical protein
MTDEPQVTTCSPPGEHPKRTLRRLGERRAVTLSPILLRQARRPHPYQSPSTPRQVMRTQFAFTLKCLPAGVAVTVVRRVR